MKRMLLSVFILIGTCFYMNAAWVHAPTVSVEEAYLMNQDDGFTEVKLESLNENVQKAIDAHTETCTIKVIGFNEEKGFTKVTFISKTDECEKVIIFDNNGKEVEQ